MTTTTPDGMTYPLAVEIHCPNCGTPLQGEHRWQETVLRCPVCRHVLLGTALQGVMKAPSETRLEPTTGPWTVESHKRGGEFSGENWLVADLGLSSEDDRHYYVTTDRVHGSEVEGDPKGDAAWMVWCRNHWEMLADLYRQATGKEPGE